MVAPTTCPALYTVEAQGCVRDVDMGITSQLTTPSLISTGLLKLPHTLIGVLRSRGMARLMVRTLHVQRGYSRY